MEISFNLFRKKKSFFLEMLTLNHLSNSLLLYAVIRRFPFLPVAPCQAAWADQWVEAVFSNAPKATRRTCFTSLFTRLRSPILTRIVRPRPRIRNPIVVSRRLTVAPPRRRGDNLPDQVEHLINRRPRPRPVSSRLISSVPRFQGYLE